MSKRFKDVDVAILQEYEAMDDHTLSHEVANLAMPSAFCPDCTADTPVRATSVQAMQALIEGVLDGSIPLQDPVTP